MSKYILTAVLLLGLFFKSFSQCTSMPPMPSCGSCTQLVDNTNINSGQTYCFSGSGTVNGVNMSAGATLIVCGNLTLNFNFNGGSIYIVTGGSLSIPGANVNSAAIYNYGTLHSTANLTLQGSGSQLMNAAGATVNMNNNQLSLSPGALINYGNVINVSNLVFQNGGTACMGNNSMLMAMNITNNVTNSVSVPSGNACLSYNGFAQLNNDLSATASLKVCKSTGASYSGSFGSATVTANCSGCSAALPVNWIYFTASKNKNSILLNWSVTGTDITSYTPEYSNNGSSWALCGTVYPQNSISDYSFTDYNNASFYRIRATDRNGRFSYSAIVRSIVSENGLIILSASPASVKIISPKGKLRITDMFGRVLRSFENTEGYTDINLSSVAPGIYIIQFMNENGNSESRKIQLY